ncbi:MAG TPA: hypothetical protein EYQ00_12920 [Dehalococcoidia bacterium]|nr:hypothetical protein [Dehalococcoidia bacterium]
MAKERANMYNAIFLLLITLFAIVSGMVGQRAMAILHAPNTVEGLTLKGMTKAARATKNRAMRKASKVVGGMESFTARQMGGILSLAGLGGKSDDDSEGE